MNLAEAIARTPRHLIDGYSIDPEKIPPSVSETLARRVISLRAAGHRWDAIHAILQSDGIVTSQRTLDRVVAQYR